MLNPGHNRVYFEASRRLALIELSAVSRGLSFKINNPRDEIIGGAAYLVFETETAPCESDLIILTRLSFSYAVFERKNFFGEDALVPLNADGKYFLDEGISRMLKYSGKTNELFTRMMHNLALGNLECESPSPDEFRVLDPLCGKGTTVFDCVSLGVNAYGIEKDEKLAHEGFVFLKKFLETAKIKHETHIEKCGGADAEGNKFSAQRRRVSIKKDGRTVEAEIISGDARNANTFYRKNYFDMIIGDLPYGIQHGADDKNKSKGRSITRNASGLLNEALPEWSKVLKKGGTIALAWNLFLIPRSEMENILIAHGFKLPEEDLYKQIPHRVDQAIERDVIVGCK